MTMKNSCGVRTGKSSVCDPYHAWLGISKERRPCSHYDLLGVPPAERDATLIETAAVSRVNHVRRYQLAYEEECTRLLGEIALALDTLVDPVKRRAYDTQLGNQAPGGQGAAALGPAKAPGRAAGAPAGKNDGHALGSKPRRDEPAREVWLALVPVHAGASARCDVDLCLRPIEAACPHDSSSTNPFRERAAVG
jgi:hypothetical protein